jgi:nucleotide-binding universal stress UspA family protein
MYDKIAVPLDGSPVAECVIPHIEALAKSPSSEVQLITVIEPVEIPTLGRIALTEDDLKLIHTEMEKDARTYHDEIAGRLRRAGIKTRSVILRGKPAETLIEYVHNNGIDLVVMATHGRSGLTKLFWGSITEKVIRAINVPVMLIKAGPCANDAVQPV